ncbi:MAG: ATP-binding protein [Nitrospiraceae bacterium]|nr:ATP-binding protein [Nitrospirota bacterium]MDA8338242.1 ATP-binding protein [Nitrospiraceae bacterium]
MKIGKVSATEKSPTTNDEFIFWVEDNFEIKPFDIIKAANNIGDKKSITYAIVKDIYYVTDSPGHIGNYISSDFGDLNSAPTTRRLGVTYAQAEVIHNNKDVYMPLRDGILIEFANEEEIKEALGLDKIKNPIPAGFLDVSNDITVPICFNSDFLIGPEGAHLNISGISGLATKTSYAMFLLQAVQQTRNDVAIIILNVKGNDLLRIDEQNPLLQDAHKSGWVKTCLECKPFTNVKCFYPFKNDGENFCCNTSCEKDALQEQFQDKKAFTYIYTYAHDKHNIDLLFSNIDDPQFTMESILNFVLEQSEFDDLDWDSFKQTLGEYTKKGHGKNKEITVQSWRKFTRLIKKSITNQIFQKSISGEKAKRQCHISDEVKKIQKGEVFVIDIAKLEEQLQGFVFGDILQAVSELKFGETDRSEDDIPKKIIIFVDELNKYASENTPKNSPILKNLLEITERGRSEGIILFSAEQFKSAIHDRVKGNCSTHIYGRTNAIETSKPDYKYIPKTFTNMMTRLDTGELIVQHPIFKTLLKIKFPYPSYYQRKGDK